MTKFILKADKVFMKSMTEFTEDYTIALRFDTIGAAMRAASQINKQLGGYTFKIIPIYD